MLPRVRQTGTDSFLPYLFRDFPVPKGPTFLNDYSKTSVTTYPSVSYTFLPSLPPHSSSLFPSFLPEHLSLTTRTYINDYFTPDFTRSSRTEFRCRFFWVF